MGILDWDTYQADVYEPVREFDAWVWDFGHFTATGSQDGPSSLFRPFLRSEVQRAMDQEPQRTEEFPLCGWYDWLFAPGREEAFDHIATEEFIYEIEEIGVGFSDSETYYKLRPLDATYEDSKVISETALNDRIRDVEPTTPVTGNEIQTLKRLSAR